MSKPSKWTWLWLSWLFAFVLIELVAQFGPHHRTAPRTLSEHLARWFPKRWRRVLLVGLLTLLAWHLWTAPDVQPGGFAP